MQDRPVEARALGELGVGVQGVPVAGQAVEECLVLAGGAQRLPVRVAAGGFRTGGGAAFATEAAFAAYEDLGVGGPQRAVGVGDFAAEDDDGGLALVVDGGDAGGLDGRAVDGDGPGDLDALAAVQDGGEVDVDAGHGQSPGGGERAAGDGGEAGQDLEAWAFEGVAEFVGADAEVVEQDVLVVPGELGPAGHGSGGLGDIDGHVRAAPSVFGPAVLLERVLDTGLLYNASPREREELTHHQVGVRHAGPATFTSAPGEPPGWEKPAAGAADPRAPGAPQPKPPANRAGGVRHDGRHDATRTSPARAGRACRDVALLEGHCPERATGEARNAGSILFGCSALPSCAAGMHLATLKLGRGEECHEAIIVGSHARVWAGCSDPVGRQRQGTLRWFEYVIGKRSRAFVERQRSLLGRQ